MVPDCKSTCSFLTEGVLRGQRAELTGVLRTQVTATGARGASTALVGTPQTIIDSILDYVELGCDLISIRGYDNLNDAIDYGRYILPGVRAELTKRGLDK